VKFKTLDNQNQPFRKVGYQELRVRNLEKLKACNRGEGTSILEKLKTCSREDSTLEKIKTCNRWDQHLGEAQDLQQRISAH
jgi:hypothetical protein